MYGAGDGVVVLGLVVWFVIGAVLMIVVHRRKERRRLEKPKIQQEFATLGEPDYSYKGNGCYLGLFQQKRKLAIIGTTDSERKRKITRTVSYDDLTGLSFKFRLIFRLEIRDMDNPLIYIVFVSPEDCDLWYSRISQATGMRTV